MEGTSEGKGKEGIGEFIQTHPQVVIGGAVGVGLLFFILNNRQSAPQVAGSAVPISQDSPPDPYLTVAQFNDALDAYNANIRDYISDQLANGYLPDPNPTPIPYVPPYGEGNPPPPGPVPGHDPNHNPGGNEGCPNGYHMENGRCVQDVRGTGGDNRNLFQIRVCPPGYTWNQNMGMCVRTL